MTTAVPGRGRLAGCAVRISRVLGKQRRSWTLAQLLVRIGQLIAQEPQVRRLELNPVLVHSRGPIVLHAKGSLDVPSPRPDTGPRRL